MEFLIMNYSDEEDVFPSEEEEGRAKSNYFTSRTPNPDIDAMQENMEIPDRQMEMLETLFPVASSPCDLKGAADNTNESSINQIDDEDNIVVISDEDDSNDVISPIIISNVECTKQSLTHHMMMTHKNKFKEGSISTEAQQLESCDLCSYPTKHSHHLGKHRQLHTVKNEPIVSCTKCDYKVPCITPCFHYRNVHESPMNKQEKAKQVYTCKFCSYTTEYENYFENHLLLHTEASSVLVEQEADLKTSFDLDKCENYSVLSPKSEREDEESDKENSAATTLPLSFSSLVGQEADTASAIDLDSSKSHTVSPIKDEEDEGINKETAAAANFAISSSFLVGQEVHLETLIDLDKCEKRSIYSPKSEREDEESGEDNSTALTLPISFCSLVGQEANTPAAIDLDKCKSHNVALIKGEEVEQIDNGNSTGIISPISSIPLVGLDADMGTVVDSSNTESRSESLLTDKQDKKSEKQNSSAVIRNPVNSLDESSKSQGEFLANGCDTSTNLQKYQDKPVISDRTTYKCKRCSYSSTIPFGLKRHMMSHSENSDLNKIKCQLCPFEAKPKKSLSNHWLVTHKIEKSRCTICDTFVPAHLKEKQRHYIDCSNKRHSISRKSEESGDQCGKSEESKQRGEINESSKQLLRCEYCFYSTKNKGNFNVHMRAHTVFNRPIYRCPECDYKSTMQNLTHHMVMVHKIKFKNPLAKTRGLKKCDFCSYTTKKKFDLKKHRQLHTVQNKPIVSCTKCDYKAPRVTLFHHYKNVHRSLMNEKGKAKQVYTCIFCSYTTEYKDYFENHLLLHTVSSSSLVGQDADLETSTDLDKCDNYSILSLEANPETAIDLCNSKSHNVSIITDEKVEDSDKEIPAAAFFPIPSSSSVLQEADLETSIDLDKYENFKSEGDKESNKENCTAPNLPISFTCLIGQDAYTATAIDLDRSKSHNVSLIKDEEDEQIDKGNSTAATSLISLIPLVGYKADTEVVVDSDNGENPLVSTISSDKEDEESDKGNSIAATLSISTRSGADTVTVMDSDDTERDSESPLTDKQDKKSEKQNSSASVVRNFINSTDESSESQGARSRKFEANSCDTSTNGSLSNEKAVQVYTCKFCSYTSKYEDNVKQHLPLHTVDNSPIYHCPKCNYKSTKVNLTKHMKAFHKVVKCDFCSYTTIGNPQLENHRRLHTVRNEPIVSCTKCDYKAPRVTLFHHYKNFHGSPLLKEVQATQVYTCKFCSHTAHAKCNLNRHIRLHTVHNRPIYRCPKCDYKSTKKLLTQHISAIHKIEFKVATLSLARQQLKRCNFSTAATFPISSSSLVRQETDTATAIGSEKCNVSPIGDKDDEETDKGNSIAVSSSISSTSLVGHRANAETAMDLDNSERLRELPLTDKEDEKSEKQNSSSVVRDSVNSTDELSESQGERSRKFEANGCDTSTNGALMNEKAMQVYRCKFCSYTSKYEYNLKQHLPLHTVDNRLIYYCPKCEYKSTKVNLTKHAKAFHKVELTKGLKCDFCSYTTKNMGHLKTHRQLHTLRNEPIVSCTKCDYKAPRVTLFRHCKKVHGSPLLKDQASQMHTCKFCSYTAHDKGSLERHIRLHTVHNRPIYRCPKCDYKSTKQVLTKHAKAIHKIEFKVATSSSATQQLRKCNFSTAATFPISSSSLVGQRADTTTAIDLGDSETCCAFSSIGNKESAGSDKETPRATNFPFSSSSLGEPRADMEVEIDLDKCENHSTYSPNSRREDEESGEENSTAEALPILFSSLVGQEANTAEDNCKSHNAAFIKDEEQIDKGNSTTIISSISSIPLVGLDGDMETVVDSDSTESPNESPLTDKQDKKSEKQNSSAVRNPVNSTSESQIERSRSRQFVANRCDTSTNLQKYQDKPVISDRTTFKCQLCSYSSTIRFRLKRHMLSHSENSDLSKIKCAHCLFETKSKKSLYNHWLVTHSKTSRCTICDTFVPTHLKQKHFLKCKPKKNVFECKECQYKTLDERIFVRHQIDCSNTRHSISSAEKQQLKSCNFCSYTTKIETDLEKHVILHTVHNRLIYHCPKCEYKSTKNNLTKHVKAVHKIEFCYLAKTKLWKCDFCSFTTISNQQLEVHRQLHTVWKESIVSCTKCDYKAPQITLTYHYKNVHRSQTDNPHRLIKITEYTCKFCSFTTQFGRSLRKHTRLHTVHNRPIYCCPECDYKAPRQTLYFHYTNVHGSHKIKVEKATQVYTCKFCSHTAHYKGNLRKHIRLHTVHNRPIYCCPKCDYKSIKKDLTQHVKAIHKIEFKVATSSSAMQQLRRRNFSTAATFPISSSSLVRQETETATAIGSEKCNVSPIGDKDNEETDKGISIAVSSSILSTSLVGHRANAETTMDSDNSECLSESPLTDKEDERSEKQNSFAVVRDSVNSTDELSESQSERSRKFEANSCNTSTNGSLMNEKAMQVYRCKFCSYTSKYEDNFKQHLPLHTVDSRPIYHCPKCEYKSTTVNLTKHVKTFHKLLKCDFCSYTTIGNQQLENHRRLHTVRNEPIVSCTKCDYKAPHVALFHHYKNVHGSPLPKEVQAMRMYTCKFCSYTAHFKYYITKHIRLHTVLNRPIYRCPKCDYKSTKKVLTQHIRAIHKIEFKVATSSSATQQLLRRNFSTAATFPISSSSLVGQRADTTAAIDLGNNSENRCALSFIGDKENDEETPRATNFPISSSSLGEQGADMEAEIDLAKREKHSMFSAKGGREDEGSYKENSTAANLPISLNTLDGQEADTASAIGSEKYNVLPIGDKEDEGTDKGNSIAVTSSILSTPLVGHKTNVETAMDLDISECLRELPLTDKEDEKSEKQNSSSVVRDSVNSTDELSESQGERSRKFEANGCNTSTNGALMNEKAMQVYRCKFCSYTSKYEYNLKQHLPLHTVDNRLIYHCPKCEYKSTKVNLTKHAKAFHKVELTKGLKCDFCSYTTKNVGRLKTHRQLHTLRNEPIVSCTKCDYKAPRVTLFHHCKNVHGSSLLEDQATQMYVHL